MSWFFPIRDKKSNMNIIICYIQTISQYMQADSLLWHNLQKVLENLPSNIIILVSLKIQKIIQCFVIVNTGRITFKESAG